MNAPAPARRPITRWRASAVHLMCSATLAALAGMLLFGVWYPQPFTKAAGADRLIVLLIGIDLVLGPLLTLIVYKNGKKGMWFDLVFIACVQVAALVYGLNMIAKQRPIFVVVSDRMTFLTPAGALSEEDLEKAEPALRRRSWTGPLIVAAPSPTDRKERDDLLFASLAGKDIDRSPHYFRDFSVAGPALVKASAPLADLERIPAAAAEVSAFVERHGVPLGQLRFQALRGRDPELDSTVVFNLADASIVGVIDVDPWLADAPKKH